MTRGHWTGSEGRRWRCAGSTPVRVALVALFAVLGTAVWADWAGATQPYETYESTVAADGPAALFRFDDTSGSSTVADSVGSYTATSSGIALGGEGPFGGSSAGDFADGAFATLPADPLNGAAAFTAEAWVDWTGGSAYEQPIFGFGTSATNYMSLTPASAPSGHPMLLEIHTGAGAAQVTAPELPASTWEYVAVSETSSGTLTLYVDGEQVGQTTGATLSPASLGSDPGEDYLGRSPLSDEPTFAGSLSNVGFYDTALSEGQIKAHYDAGEFPVSTATPAISGGTQVGDRLSASGGSWTGSEPISYGYQWQRCTTGAVGGEGSGDGQFDHPGGLAIDAGGDLWVADTRNDRIEEFDEGGEYLRQFGAAGTGEGQLEGPDGIAIDAHGDVWVADTYNDRVEEFSATGEYLRQFGSPGSEPGELDYPEGIAVEGDGDVWVADTSGGRLEEFSESGEYLRSAGTSGSGPGQVGEPEGLAIDAKGDVWAADWENDRVEEFNAAGEYVQEFGSEGSGHGQFELPYGIALNSKGDVLVGDLGNDRIDEFNEAGEYVREFGSYGLGAGQFRFGYPMDLAVDSSGNVWIADSENNRLEEFSESGEYLGKGVCANIDGATAASYLLTSADVGSEMRVSVTATNPAGEATVTSLPSAAIEEPPEVSEEPPVSVIAPTVTGTVADGQTLSAEVGSWTGSEPISYAYQWQRCDGDGESESCTNIPGATGASYVLGHSDVGTTVRVMVSAENAVGSSTSASEVTAVVAARPPSNTESPTISGTASEAHMLTASTGSWAGTPPLEYAYQWRRCDAEGGECADIAAATGASYELAASDVDATVEVVVSASNSVGSSSATSVASTVVTGPPTSTEEPAVTGTDEAGETLSASAGAWSGYPSPTLAYQWQSCDASGGECVDVEGVTSSTYALGGGDLGTTLRVVVSATSSAGEASSSSAPTGVITGSAPSSIVSPAISGTAEEDQSLSASVGLWEGSAQLEYSFQWQRCDASGEECADVEGATASTYTPGPRDVGSTLDVTVTASNSVGVESVASAVTAAVGTSATVPRSLAPPEILGSAQQGQTLRASAGTWTGATPLSYAYQWERCNGAGEDCSEISGASTGVHQLSEADTAHTLRVLVTVSNADGSASRISPPSDVVEGPQLEAELECTDTWVGGSFESWDTPWDWSAGSAPGPSDVACIGAETVEVPVGATDVVGVLHDTGELEVLGSLELVETAHASSVDSLVLASGYDSIGTITGAGSLVVSGYLEWSDGTMSGSGRTVIAPGVASTFGKEVSLTSRRLVNEGTLVLAEGDAFRMAEGASLENDGTFEANSQGSSGGVRILDEGVGSTPTILNTGTFEKAEGSGTTTIAVPFTNDGEVRALSGTLRFDDGGVSAEAATGAWSTVDGAVITLGSGAFTVGETVDLDDVGVEALGTTVTQAAAPASTTAPSISGSAEEGHTLSVSAGAWSGAEPRSLAYQWRRCNASGENCGQIAGATSSSYVVGAADGGSTLQAIVTATNEDGSALASTTATAAVPVSSPANTTSPSITGTAQDGQTLSASPGAWSGSSPIAYSYQWETCDASGRECTALESATTSRYALSEGDIGATLRVVVSASNAGGSVQATSSPSPVIEPEPPSELEAPSISGTADVGQVLEADAGSWTGSQAQFSYQWESCDEAGGECAPVEGATSPEYELTEGDLATTLRVRVGVHGALDSLSDVSPVSAVVGTAGAFANAQAPRVSGAAQVGQALTAEPGSWSADGSVSYAYQWQSCDLDGSGCGDVSGADAASYVPVSGDAGHRLRVLISATDEHSDSVTLASTATQPIAAADAPVVEQAPAVAGPALVGQTLTAETGVFSSEGSISYSYQWERCAAGGGCEAIEAATHSSYTLIEGDLGSTVVALVSASDGGDSTTAVSPATAKVEPEALSSSPRRRSRASRRRVAR